MGTAAFAFSQLFLILIFAAPLVLCGRVLYLAITRPKNYSADPACEKCRYRIVGLNTFTCPECGTDLRRTGIITPAMEMRRRGSTFGAIVAWSFIALAAGLLMVSIGSVFMVSQVTSGMGMRSTSTLVPTSATFAKVEIASTFAFANAGPTGAARIAEATLFDSAGQEWTLTFDSTLSTCTTKSPSGTVLATATVCDEDAVKAWFTSAGLVADTPPLAAEAKELANLVTVQAMAPMTPVGQTATLRAFTLSGVSSTSIANPAGGPNTQEWFAVVMIIITTVLILAWVGGIVFIILRRAKLMREAVRYDRVGASALA